MRELRVIGLETDGRTVVCEDARTGERFSLPVDARLRAAASGDLETLGRADLPSGSRLTPREIQARIRAGATVDEVAAAAGSARSRIEVFAHPVLLERDRFASLGRAAHPIRPDGPAVETLDEIVSAALDLLGVGIDDAGWDAWKTREGSWTIRYSWPMGHTRNTAHWRFEPDGHGGSVAPLDDGARRLIDPDIRRPLQSLPPVTALTPEREPITGPASTSGFLAPGVPTAAATLRPSAAPTPSVPDDVAAAGATELDTDGPDGFLRHPDDEDAPRRPRRPKPPMPSWEDVLLGVRSRPGE